MGNIENDVNENVNDDQYSANNEGNYDGSFGLSQFINLPRLPKNMDRREIRKQQKNGELSKSDIEYAKIIHRRMERKKIIINIYYDPTPPPPPSSLTKNRHKLSPIKLIGGLFHNKNKRKSSSSNYYDRESSSSSYDDDDEENEANDGG